MWLVVQRQYDVCAAPRQLKSVHNQGLVSGLADGLFEVDGLGTSMAI
jgi:hypothetical protein